MILKKSIVVYQNVRNIGVAGLEGQFVTLNAHIRKKKDQKSMI